jgi:hypothetical protein
MLFPSLYINLKTLSEYFLQVMNNHNRSTLPGECWSGPSQDESSFKEDGSSTECVNTDWKECSDQSKFACAGKQFNNYVYAIVS